jgi:dipeptidyl aminopeptidase/acylaminoacyl peptidase
MINFRQILKYFVLLPGFYGFWSCTEIPHNPPLITAEQFFSTPQKTNFKISPDGSKIAFLRPWNARSNLFVYDFESDDTTQITSYDSYDLTIYEWGNDKKIIYLMGVDDSDNLKLFSVDISTRRKKQLTPAGNSTVSIIDNLTDYPDEVIVRMNARNRKMFDVYRININSGERTLIAENPGNIIWWLTDHDGLLRVAVTSDGVNHGIMYRDNEESDFKLIKVTHFRDFFHPLMFSFDNKDLIVVSNIGRDKSAIVKYDINEDREKEIIFKHNEVDAENIIKSDTRKKIVGVTYVTWKKEYEFFDEETRELKQQLDKRLKCDVMDVSSMSRDERKIIIRTYSDRDRGSFYYFDRGSDYITKLTDYNITGSLDDMAPMKPVQFKTRDGLTVRGYLTLPVGKNPENLPVVIYPHAGPMMRDTWEFSNVVQFLANRGYGVFQINFRGSTGFGKKFWEAGFKQWGLKMQDDITDGVEWLIKQGIADPDKVAIIGDSYGGFSALAGAIKTPGLYKCCVSRSGILDIKTFLYSIPEQWEPFKEMLYQTVGDPVKDEEMLESVSPFHNIDKIKIPVMLAYGARDSKVPLTLVKKTAQQLKENNIPVEIMIKEDEGHIFRREANRIEYYKRLEKFLDKYLMGTFER